MHLVYRCVDNFEAEKGVEICIGRLYFAFPFNQMSLPATTRLLRQKISQSDALRNLEILLVQHLMEDTLKFVSLLLEAGMFVRTVIGIPYSVKPLVVESLQNLGIEVIVPRLEELPDAIVQRAEKCSREGSKLLLHEVGGYAALLAGKSAIFKETCLGIVEETMQGLWRYSGMEALGVPVVHFADTKLKALESEFVGRAVTRSIEDDLITIGNEINGTHVSVVGFGNIGAAVARNLRNRGARVSCFDKNAIKMIEALAHGFLCKDLIDIISDSHVIAGATGGGCIPWELVPRLRSGTLLSSASSRDIEFPVELIRKNSISQNILNRHVCEHKLSTGQTLYVSDSGFPVNFRTISLPLSFGDLMFCQVLLGLTGLANGHYSLGLQRLSRSDEEEIARVWWDHYGANGLIALV